MNPEQFMLEAIKQPIIYGKTDCVRTVCKWVLLQTGRDPMTGIVSWYDRNWADENLPHTSLIIWARRAMRVNGFKRAKDPKSGDVGVLVTGAQIMCAAILGDSMWMWRNEQGGMSAVGRDAVKFIAWSI